MNELLKTFRLAFYVCALPLVATAVASAHTWVHDDGGSTPVEQDLESVDARPAGVGVEVGDVVPIHDHVLRIDQTGGVTGRVMTRESDGMFGALGMEVSLNRQGEALASASTSEDGRFRLENVEPGSYTFIATSPVSVSTFGVYVLADENFVPAADQIQLDVAAANGNIDEVRQLLNSDVEPGVEYTYTPKPDELIFQTATTQVTQGSDGSLSGRVVPLHWLDSATRFDLTGNDVYLFNASGLVGRVPLASDGSYSIENVAPGIYDFVSFGPHGAAAMSIEVNPFDPVAAAGDSPFSLASASKVIYDNGADVVLGEPVVGTLPVVPPPLDIQVIVDQPMGGFGGGGGGGYAGAGGGFGGFGDLIGAALAAWVLTEAIDNDNNNNQPPVTVPPVQIPPNISPFGS